MLPLIYVKLHLYLVGVAKMKSIILTGKHSDESRAIIDSEDYEKISKYVWYLDSLGYPRRSYTENGKNKTVRLHQEIIGKAPGLMAIDHINRDKLDNRKVNLRIVPIYMNCFNKSMQSNNSTGFVGVSRSGSKWRSELKYQNKKILDKTFFTIDEAIEARKAAERMIGDYLANRT